MSIVPYHNIRNLAMVPMHWDEDPFAGLFGWSVCDFAGWAIVVAIPGDTFETIGNIIPASTVCRQNGTDTWAFNDNASAALFQYTGQWPYASLDITMQYALPPSTKAKIMGWQALYGPLGPNKVFFCPPGQHACYSSNRPSAPPLGLQPSPPPPSPLAPLPVGRHVRAPTDAMSCTEVCAAEGLRCGAFPHGGDKEETMWAMQQTGASCRLAAVDTAA